MEVTKINELFRCDYMAWGLAEFDAEQRGYKEGVSDGISQGISQGEHKAKIETAIKFLTMGISIEQVAQGTGLSIEEVNLIYNNIK